MARVGTSYYQRGHVLVKALKRARAELREATAALERIARKPNADDGIHEAARAEVEYWSQRVAELERASKDS